MVCIGWTRPCTSCGGDVCDDDDDMRWDAFGRPYHRDCFEYDRYDDTEDDDDE